MKYTSTKSQGYEPKMSGSNTMYYTGGSGSLLGMMQDGGVSPAALASLRRAKQYREDVEYAEKLAAEQAKKEEKSGLWGTIGRTLGRFIPGAGGFVGGFLGDYIGSKEGYGDEVDFDDTKVVYGKNWLKDAKARQDELLGDDKSFKLPGVGMLLGDINYQSGLAGDASLRSGQELLEGIKFASNFIMPGAGAAMGASGIGAKPSNPLPMETEGLLGDVEVPEFDSSLNAFGGSSTVSTPLISNPSASGNIINNSYASGTSSPYYDDNLPEQFDFFQDGGLLGYQNGGYTASSVLGSVGYTPTDVQLEQFEAFDTTGIDKAKEKASKSLLDMTAGQGLASLGAGFGGKGQMLQTALDTTRESIEDTTTSELSDYGSKIVNQAAKMEASGDGLQTTEEAQQQTDYNRIHIPSTYTSDPNWSPPSAPQHSQAYAHSFDDGTSQNYVYLDPQSAGYAWWNGHVGWVHPQSNEWKSFQQALASRGG